MRRWHSREIVSSHEVAADTLGRMTKYVYDNPGSGRAVAVVNCTHQFDQEFVNGEAEVKASLDFQYVPGHDNPVMKLSVVVMLRRDPENDRSEDCDQTQEA
jgi:hypothetical protein